MAKSIDLTEKQLGEFRVLRRLGGGGMADVYLAEQSALGRHVALKVMRPDLMSVSNNVMVKRFRQEAMMAAGLNHPNIVQVYTIGEEQGFHYIAQEFVQGKNLAQLLKAKKKADVGSTLHIMRQVASALRASGQAGIVHRDIKPENIMLTKSGEVKVTDFGLAQLGEKKEGSLTQLGMTLGTPLYMSPEQVQGKELDPRTDIYSFGVTCYHMLCGAPPFKGATPMAIAIQHVNEVPTPISQIDPSVPGPLASMIHLMMAQDRDERYQDADQVAQDIKKLITARKARQDLNLVKLPCLSEIEADRADASDKGATPAAAKQPAKPKKSTRRKGGTGSKPKMAALAARETISLPEVNQTPEAPTPSRRQQDEEEEFELRPAQTEFDEMDLTPMVDVTFLLLIFFMITASFTLQNTITVPPPDPNEGASMKPVSEEMQQESVNVNIDAENNITVENEVVQPEFDDLVSAIEQKMGEAGKTALLLEAQPESRSGLTVMVFDAAMEAGIQKLRQRLPTDE